MNRPDDLPLLLTPAEVAEFLRLPNRKALYAMVERGQIPAVRMGRRLRFRREDLLHLIHKSSRASSPKE